jgi:hypothetical protein
MLIIQSEHKVKKDMFGHTELSKLGQHLTFSRHIFFNWIIYLHTIFQIGERPAERAQKSWVVGDEQWSDTFVVVDMRARGNKE